MEDIWRAVSRWYIAGPVLAGLGIVLGVMVFFYVFPGKPKIAVIDIPFVIINDNSAYIISEFLQYAGRDDSIKGVFIRLNSPGGGAAASEQLYFETRKLREKKPVVIMMNDIVASGGYMMSMGASYLYAKPSSFVGNVGVILSFPGPFISRPPGEQVVPTGPFKLNGGSRRDFISLTDQLKWSFGSIVVNERGHKFKNGFTETELLQARIYSGMESVRNGMADEIGGDGDGIEKAAELAGVTDYDLVDVNTEVFRSFNQKFARIIEPLSRMDSYQTIGHSADLVDLLQEEANPSLSMDGLKDTNDMDSLRRYLMTSGLGDTQAEVLPGFPLKVNGPNVYYLYVGPAQ